MPTSLLIFLEKAYLHRDIYISIIDAYLPHKNVSQFAKDIGISPQWLSYFRNRKSKRMPSPELAKQISESLPAPHYYKKAFLEHLSQSREAFAFGIRDVAFSSQLKEPIDGYISDLRDLFSAAVFTSPSIQITRQRYFWALEIAEILAKNLNPYNYPLEYLEVCSTLLHIHSTLDQVADGLYWAKLGHRMVMHMSKADFRVELERQRWARLRVLLARDEALGYYNLGLPKQAQDIYKAANSLLGKEKQNYRELDYRELEADLARNQLISLSALPRFAIGDAETLANIAEKHFDSTGAVLNALLTREALARAYLAVAHETNINQRRAAAVLNTLMMEIEAVPDCGSLHRAVVLKSIASLCWHKGEHDEWEFIMRELLRLTTDAGLLHQYTKIQKEYGSALDRLNNELA